MKKASLVILVLVLVLVLGAASAPEVQAGPWGNGRHKLYAKVSYGYLGTTDLATPAGEVVEIPRFEKHAVDLFISYGLDDRVTAFLGTSAWSESSIDGFDSASGSGDMRAGLQVHLARHNNWAFAAHGSVQAPTGDETLGQGLLPTGSGAWEGEFVFSAGTPFAADRGWFFAEVGHRFRGKGLRDSFIYEAQIGYALRPHVRLSLNLRGLEPYDSQPGEGALASAAGLGDGVTYTVYGTSLLFDLGGGWGLALDAEDSTHARSLATGVAFRAGLTFAN